MANAPRDENYKSVLLGETNDSNRTPTPLKVDPVSKRVLIDVDGGGGSPVEIFDEGISLTGAVSSVDFVGAGVTATNTGDAVTVTIPGGGSPAWGDITGTLSNQTDLQTALDAKQDTLTGLTATVTELNYTDGVTSAIQTQLDGKFTLQAANVVNESGADVDQRFEGDTDTNLFFVDASTDRVGIGTNTPAALLDVDGTARVTTLNIGGTDVTSSAAELNILDGATLTVTELNYVDGVTSAIQTQIDAKPTISSGAGAPASTPTKVGDIYIDTTNDDAYLAVGTASSSDWEKSNDGAGGGISDGDKGDITVSASGATWTIDNDVVTYAKMQNVSATSRILGRVTASAGDVEELTAANVMSILGITSTASELNALDGITATVTELNYTDGVTSAIQTQLDTKAPLASPTLTGTTTVTDLVINETASYDAEVDNGNSGTADTIDWGVGNVQKTTVNGNVTYTFTAPAGPCHLTLKMVHEASATSYTRTWPATVKWAGGVAPTWTNTSGSVDIATFYYDGTNYYGAGNTGFA